MAKVMVKVVGHHCVAGVYRPGTVELDSDSVNVNLLVKTGMVEVVTTLDEPPAQLTIEDVPPEVADVVKTRKKGGDRG